MLQIGGMSAVQLNVPLDPPDAVIKACPAIVVLIDIEIDALDPVIQAQLDHSVLAGGIFMVDDILKSQAQITWLTTLANLKEEPN